MKSKLRKTLTLIALTLAVILAACWFFFWQLLAAVQGKMLATATIEVTHVDGAVYRLDALRGGRSVSGAVAALIGSDGVLLVDTTIHPVLVAKIRAALDDLGAGPVRKVINTHPHPDHVGGNRAFEDGVEIIAHPRTRHWMASPVKPFPFLPRVPPQPAVALPQAMTGDSQIFRFNDEEVRLLHVGAGHTDGDLVVHFVNAGVAHVGDLFHGGGSHSVASWVVGGDIVGLERGLAALVQKLPTGTRIITGHGPPNTVASVEDLTTYHAMLADTLSSVREQLATGAEEDAIVAAGVPAAWQSWFAASESTRLMHGPPEGWLRNIVRSLQRP